MMLMVAVMIVVKVKVKVVVMKVFLVTVSEEVEEYKPVATTQLFHL